MKTFRKHLKEKLKDEEFKEMYEEEKQLLEIAMKIVEFRNGLGYSQKELANKAHVTQQQLSKIENGMNCNIMTILKVCFALGIKLNVAKVA
jgi:HTH-type transcriptional regulator / antitoxin HipB